MINKTKVKENFSLILENIEYQKIAKMMNSLDWKWATCKGVPTELNMREMINHLFEVTLRDTPEITTDDVSWSSSGGFTVSIYPDNNVQVDFGLTYNSEFYIEE